MSRSFSQARVYPPREPRATQDIQLQSFSLTIDRKKFHVALKENARGQFVRITEEIGGRFDSVVIPASGFTEFCESLQRLGGSITEPPANQERSRL